jgi:predicted anti-sigma-YlaC factor YlaD
MMHCTMDDLLALSDGEASVWARRHVEECAACRAELDGLYQRVAQLKALPALRPPRDRWGVVRDTIVAQRTQRRRRWAGYGLATAAAVVGLMVLGPMFGNIGIADELRQAKQQSARLESTLQDYDPESRVMSGREAEITARLEDQIAQVDGRLADLDAQAAREAQLVDLWRQRVQLMEQLVQVRVTRAKYVGL